LKALMSELLQLLQYSFNRTLEELKVHLILLLTAKLLCFNRTLEELKEI